MISASGSDPLERRGKCTLILRVIQLMNDPGPEALADPTLIMLREPHLGGAGGDASLAEERRLGRRRSGAQPAGLASGGASLRRVSTEDIIAGTLKAKYEGRANGCHHFRDVFR